MVPIENYIDFYSIIEDWKYLNGILRKSSRLYGIYKKLKQTFMNLIKQTLWYLKNFILLLHYVKNSL